MTRKILRALNPLIFVLLVTIALALQSSLFTWYPLNYLQPDIILLAVVWCALRRDFGEGGMLTLIFAHIAELHSSAPRGLFLSTYMAVFLGIRALSVRFVFTEFNSMVGLTFGASVAWRLAGLGLLYALGEGHDQWRHTLALLFPGAVMESIFAAWVYRGLDLLDMRTFKSAKAERRSEADLVLDEEGL